MSEKVNVANQQEATLSRKLGLGAVILKNGEIVSGSVLVQLLVPVSSHL